MKGNDQKPGYKQLLARARELCAAGRGWREIGKIVGISVSTLRGYAEREKWYKPGKMALDQPALIAMDIETKKAMQEVMTTSLPEPPITHKDPKQNLKNYMDWSLQCCAKNARYDAQTMFLFAKLVGELMERVAKLYAVNTDEHSQDKIVEETAWIRQRIVAVSQEMRPKISEHQSGIIPSARKAEEDE